MSDFHGRKSVKIQYDGGKRNTKGGEGVERDSLCGSVF